jgi:hypothetical protein
MRMNMSYCRFQNTVSDLEDCFEAMCGEDEYYQSKADISEDEFTALERMIELCRDIVNMADDDEISLLKDGDKIDPNDIEDDDDAF